MTDTCPQCGGEFKSVGVHMGRSSSCELTDEVLLDELHQLNEKIGKPPTVNDMNNVGRFSHEAYYKTFENWNTALKEANLKINSEMNIDCERFVDELKRLADELGRTPRQSDVDKYGKFHSTAYRYRFGLWNNALKAAGLELSRYNISKDVLLKELDRLADELGKTPSLNDMNKDGKFSSDTYQRNFGSWNDALKEAGFDPVLEYPIKPQWGDNIEDYYGESWPQKRAKTVERDNYKCRVCGDDGLLHVHHIKPRRMFEYPDDSNTLDNLVTLCASCHGRFEGQWVDADVDSFIEKARRAYGKTSGVQRELREPIL